MVPTEFPFKTVQEKSDYYYAPYYCEENIWQLANTERHECSKVVFISNRNHQCALWNQKIGQPGEPVVWDYHVVYLFAEKNRWLVFDFDTVLPWGLPLTSYLLQTFDASVDSAFLPCFRLIPTQEFLQTFSSDRRHMQDALGNWLQPAPDWPAIHQQSMHNLHLFIDIDRPSPGIVVDLETLRHLPLPE